ncbi:MAG: YegP family protein [Isosphaeraceae bacterium]
MTATESRCGLFTRTFLGVAGLAVVVGVSMGAPTAAFAAPQAAARAKAKTQASRTLRFETFQDRGMQYRWRLRSSNGQVIATSGQGYKDKRDRDSAIERIRKDAATKLKFESYEDNAKTYRWRLRSSNGQVIATSGQGYKDKRDCEHAIDAIKKGAANARVEEAKEE